MKSNVSVPGFSHFSCQSHSQNGGVAVYVTANTFNSFFVNVSQNVTKTISRTTKSQIDFMGDRMGHSCFIAPLFH